MILTPEREALVQQLVIQLHDTARASRVEGTRDLADCISYMHKLWKSKAKRLKVAEKILDAD